MWFVCLAKVCVITKGMCGLCYPTIDYNDHNSIHTTASIEPVFTKRFLIADSSVVMKSVYYSLTGNKLDKCSCD